MSIRLDPRRLGTLKRLAADADTRPGDLVRQWIEERIDASRAGADGTTLDDRLKQLERRIAALESAEPVEKQEQTAEQEQPAEQEQTAADEAPKRRARARVSAAPSGPRVALHDEMIAVLAERGPMTAAELAAAVAERGRYTPPRSGKPLDAAMVSQRVSNPTYRPRFTRDGGRIGLAE
jgi:TolA-binding protein